MRCARHPSVETELSCSRCGTPLCPRCLVQTEVGQRCPTCAPQPGKSIIAIIMGWVVLLPLWRAIFRPRLLQIVFATATAVVWLSVIAGIAASMGGGKTNNNGRAADTSIARTGSTASGKMIVTANSIVTATNGGFVEKSGGSLGSLLGLQPVSYGIVLHNSSPHLAAIGVRVNVTFASQQGSLVSVLPVPDLVSGVPAGGTFFLSGSADINAAPAKMSVTISVEHTTSAHLVLPTIKVGLTGSVLPHAAGTFQNPYPRSTAEQGWELDEGGVIYLVYFDSRGQFIGGDKLNVDTSSAVPGPGITAPFTDTKPAPANAVSVQASMDPCDNLRGLSTSCVAYQSNSDSTPTPTPAQ